MISKNEIPHFPMSGGEHNPFSTVTDT